MNQVTTTNPADLAQVVTECAANRRALVDYGIAHTQLGSAPPTDHTALTQTGSIIEHYVRDLTVRAAAGMTIDQLQHQLADTGQFLPIDADGDITLGEVIDCNVYGPLRVGYGSIRDLMLGLHYIDGEGRDIHVGGRTVKNVAGYDLARFMVGALGQFGIVHEATVRTYAIPEQVTIANIAVHDPASLDGKVTAWQLSAAWPTWISLAFQAGSWKLTAGYYGKPNAHAVQLDALKAFIADIEGVDLIDTTTAALADDLTNRQASRAWRRSATSLVKVVVPPASTGAAAKLLAPHATRVDALPAHGCLFADLPHDEDDLTDLLAECGGFRVWYTRPGNGVETCSPQPTDWDMLVRLKRSMDPHDIFNPGRFLPVLTEATAS